MTAAVAPRVLIAGVGYRNLRDHSVGPLMIDRLESHQWTGDVSVEDLSFGPIAVVQRLQDDSPERAFGLAIFVAGVSRPPLRDPGSLTCYRWDAILPGADDVQRAVTEAVTGVIALDNTLTVCGHFRTLPAEVVVVEVEPQNHEFGDGFSPPVAQAFDAAHELIIALAEHPERVTALPTRALGGWVAAPVEDR